MTLLIIGILVATFTAGLIVGIALGVFLSANREDRE